MAVALAVPLSLQLVGDTAAQPGYRSLLAPGSGSLAETVEMPGVANQSSFADFQHGTAHLVTARSMMSLIRHVADSGTTVVVATHDEAAADHADRLIHIEGRIVD